MLSAGGRYQEAETLFRDALETQKVLLGAESPDLGETLSGYAWLHLLRGEYEEADSKLREVVAIFRPLRDRYPARIHRNLE